MFKSWVDLPEGKKRSARRGGALLEGIGSMSAVLLGLFFVTSQANGGKDELVGIVEAIEPQ
jgi:hypothetical protein